MRDYVTGIDFDSSMPAEYWTDARTMPDAESIRYRKLLDAANMAMPIDRGAADERYRQLTAEHGFEIAVREALGLTPSQPMLYRTLRTQRRHLYDGKRYAPASTHAEAMEKFGFRVTSGGAR